MLELADHVMNHSLRSITLGLFTGNHACLWPSKYYQIEALNGKGTICHVPCSEMLTIQDLFRNSVGVSMESNEPDMMEHDHSTMK